MSIHLGDPPTSLFRVVWEIKGLFNNLTSRVRVVDMGEGEYIMEVIYVSQDDSSFWSRLKRSMQYLFNGGPMTSGFIPLSEEDLSGIRKGCEIAEPDCKDSEH